MILRLKQRIAPRENVDPIGASFLVRSGMQVFLNGSDAQARYAFLKRSGSQATYAALIGFYCGRPRSMLACLSGLKFTNELKEHIKKPNKINGHSPTTPQKFTNELKDRTKGLLKQGVAGIKNRICGLYRSGNHRATLLHHNKNLSFS